uniref:Hydrophobic seed protein domain-containing protein n=1 Tax=Setaria viridis TaxID=4556 RepID=A0A4U6VV87_SETVI|nr:hypothetical protein SEVIR_2G201400v2 [Setaria viridis]
MPPSRIIHLILLATLSLLLTQTLASSSLAPTATTVVGVAAELGDPCVVADGDVALCSVRCFRSDPVVGAGSAPVSGQALLLVHIVWLFVLGAATRHRPSRFPQSCSPLRM